MFPIHFRPQVYSKRQYPSRPKVTPSWNAGSVIQYVARALGVPPPPPPTRHGREKKSLLTFFPEEISGKCKDNFSAVNFSGNITPPPNAPTEQQIKECLKVCVERDYTKYRWCRLTTGEVIQFYA